MARWQRWATLQKAASLASELRVSYAGCHSLSMCHTELNTMVGHWGIGSKYHLSEAVIFSVPNNVLSGKLTWCGQPTHRKTRAMLLSSDDGEICPMGMDVQWQVQDNWPQPAMQSDHRRKPSSCSLWKETCTLGPMNPMADRFEQTKTDTKTIKRVQRAILLSQY